MLKKIILGIVIAVVLSVTAFGTIYAYQKEKAKTDESAIKENLSLQYGAGPAEDCNGAASGDCEECLKEKERIRNNLRQRQNEDGECAGQDGEEHMWQYRYEYENRNLENKHDRCIEEGQFKNQNGNNSNRRGGK